MARQAKKKLGKTRDGGAVLLTGKEAAALKNWAELNKYLQARRLDEAALAAMLEWELANKQRVNVITRLNNKLFQLRRNAELKRLLAGLRR